MICQDCIHYRVCENITDPSMKQIVNGEEVEKHCTAFIDKSLCIKLPCKVGDKVYKLWSCGRHGKSVAEFEVKHIDIDYYPNIEVAYIKPSSKTGSYSFSKAEDFGKTVFLTREEAEKALAERSRND